VALYEAGCTWAEIEGSELRHLLMRLEGYRRRMRREEVMTLGLRNEVRSAFGADPIDPYDAPTGASVQNDGDLDAFKYRVQQETDIDIDRDLTT